MRSASRKGAVIGHGRWCAGAANVQPPPVLTLPEAFILRNGAFVRGARISMYILINNKVERCHADRAALALHVKRGFRFSTNAAIASRPSGPSAIIAITSDA